MVSASKTESDTKAVSDDIPEETQAPHSDPPDDVEGSTDQTQSLDPSTDTGSESSSDTSELPELPELSEIPDICRLSLPILEDIITRVLCDFVDEEITGLRHPDGLNKRTVRNLLHTSKPVQHCTKYLLGEILGFLLNVNGKFDVSPRELLGAVNRMYKGLAVCKYDDRDVNLSWASPLVKFYLRLTGVTNVENSLHMPDALESDWTATFLDSLAESYEEIPDQHVYAVCSRMAVVEDFLGIYTLGITVIKNGLDILHDLPFTIIEETTLVTLGNAISFAQRSTAFEELFPRVFRTVLIFFIFHFYKMSCELQCEDENLGMLSWMGGHDAGARIWDLLLLYGKEMKDPWALEGKLDCELAREAGAGAAAVPFIDWDALSFALGDIDTSRNQ